MDTEMPSVSDTYVDLKPDSSLLDASFDGYKLSLDNFVCVNAPLPSAVGVLQTSNAQYGLEHVKLFSDLNYLAFDWHSSTDVTLRFYLVTHDYRLCSVTFNTEERAFSGFESVLSVTVPSDAISREDRYPVTVSFPGPDLAVVANGYGMLSLFCTGDRSTNSPWKECLNTKPLLHDDDSGAFVVTESRGGDGRVEVLLRTVVAKERPSSKTHFWNKLFWISINRDEGGWRVGRAREVTCEGHVEMATLDSALSKLIVASNGDTTFTADSVSCVEKTKPSQGNEGGAGDIEEPMEGERKRYVWMQGRDEVSALFNLGTGVDKKDVAMELTGSHIQLLVKDVLLLEGHLGGSVNTEGSTCTIDNNRLELTLSKSGDEAWSELVQGDEGGSYHENKDDLLTFAQCLDPLTADINRDEGTGRTFNTEQLEDCDMATDDQVCKVRWLCGETHAPCHVSDITGHSVLFTAALGIGPRSLCVRMDVDGILWALDGGQGSLATHKATFNALGYVQASKTQRKFCTCSPDCSYAVIVEGNRHAFVYWQPSDLNSELRHRGSGRRVAAVAKQSLISLCKIDGMNEKIAATEDIVGVFAHNSAIFILTTAELFAVILK